MKTYNKVINCHFCYESFELNFEVDNEFSGWNSEIFDCTICCNPNRVDYEITEQGLTSLFVENGND